MRNNDLSEIEALIRTYLDGLYEGNAEKIASVFHQTSALTQMFDGKLMITPRDQWLEAVRNRAPPQAQGLVRDDHIISIDIAGPSMAYVKLKCAIPPRYFTDQLSCLKIDGRWQVAQKVFMTEVFP
jgi:hypothetical protein